ncbi:RagB/SusD family nutrient uptake outer membrane protein [Chitinophaga nivalis]|uniref:RagB/SusD family nutrient uptake outer membrane protein n=1 Tax=Chitinophaga nivalis TaxID=2991709 RepID=A0ABT3IEF7_9BACT|nr:RagB/SusD family nutrient uptake outer membrane protein [Chitinophaga nivalis]MCW3467969.1 RagB/SusD family nutrient uptake outer membrane protein [Chitinophaga nivalis]MCW3482340.1 RagB/SusD family nutrient uptake outer membrane protein [Chitinophaga nivalis]
MKQLFFLTGIAIILLTGACGKFLNEQPQNQLSPDQYWKTEDDIVHALAGVYDGIQVSLSNNYVYWGDARTDNFNVTQYGNKQFALNGLSATIPGSDWAPLYLTIGRANMLLKKAPGVKNVPISALSQYQGETLAIRAWCYFTLVRLWGDVPVWLTPYEDLAQSPYKTRTGTDSIFNGVILPDLLKAYDLLNMDHNNLFNINKGSIAAILIDAYMWRHDYTNALKWMDKLAALNWYSLEPTATWKNMFTYPAGSVENIWNLSWDYLVDGGAGIASLVGCNDNNSDFMADDSVWNHFLVDTTDIRGKQTVDLKARDKVLKFYAVKLDNKGRQLYPKSSETNIQYPMYRYADIILLRAEALQATGQPAAALDQLNRVHTRAGMKAYTAADFPAPGDLLNGILRERQWEFFCECKRWFDLRRNGKVKEVMDPVLKARQADNPGYSHPGLLLWPINRDNLNANPYLKQNPPYSE